MLYRNLPLKIAALALAIFLWFWVTINVRGSRQPGNLRMAAPGITTVAARSVPVVLATRGALPPGLKVVSVVVEPPIVTITGPALRVGKVSEVRTSDLDITGRRETFSAYVSLVVPEGVRVPNTTMVKVTVNLEQEAPAAPPEGPGAGES